VKLFDQICWGIITAGIFFLSAEAGLLERGARQDLHLIATDTHTAMLKMDAVIGQAQTVENRAIDASERVTAAAQQQSDYWQKTQKQVYEAIVDAKKMIGRTDISLNGRPGYRDEGVLPTMAKTLEATISLQTAAVVDLDSTTKHVNDTIDAYRPMIDNAIRATGAAATAMSDPAIHETMVNLASTSGHADKTFADVQHIADGWVAPIKGFWNHVRAIVVPAAVDAAQVATPIFAKH